MSECATKEGRREGIHTYIYKTSLVLVDYTNKGKEEAKERARVVDRDCHHIDNPNKSAL